MARRKKILLIEPPFLRLSKETYALVKYPLSLGYLAAAIRTSTEWDLLVYNGDFSPTCEVPEVTYLTGEGFQNYLRNLQDLSQPIWQEVQATVASYGPSVVGISAKSPTFAAARAVARLVKAVDSRILVAVGGPHPTIKREQVLVCLDIDVCVVGEGERTIVELLRAVEGDVGLADVRGIVYRDGGRLVTNPAREPVDDLDALSFPHLFAAEVLKDYEQYPAKAFRHVFATRGCPRNCAFCASRAVWGGRVRLRSPASVVSEVKSLQAQGLNFVHFDDDLFGVNPRYLRALVGALSEECSGVRWSCETHVKLITDESVSRMKAAGCYMIQLGIESGNNRILKAMRKGYTIDEALAACQTINRHDLSLETFFIVGYPLDTEETLQDTRAAIEKVDCDKLAYSIFTPYPGTDGYEFCRAHGLIDEEFDPALYNHQSPANNFCLNVPADRFRAMAEEIEGIVDAKNRAGREKRLARYARLLGPRYEPAPAMGSER
jgi:anaerobic magnesium-protoporphyrin IX monomethyl ester cyclase